MSNDVRKSEELQFVLDVDNEKKESCLKFHTSNNAYMVKYSFMKITTYRDIQAQIQYTHNSST